MVGILSWTATSRNTISALVSQFELRNSAKPSFDQRGILDDMIECHKQIFFNLEMDHINLYFPFDIKSFVGTLISQ